MRWSLRSALARLRSGLRGLRFKATAAVASFVVMISVVLTTLFVMYVEQSENQAVMRRAADTASLLSVAVARGVELGDPGLLAAPLAAVREDGDAMYVAIRDRHGVLALDSADPVLEDLTGDPPPSGLPRSGVAIEKRLVGEAEPILEVVAPVFGETETGASSPDLEESFSSATEPIGWVQLGISLRPTQAKLAQFRTRARGIAIIVIVLGMLGTMFLVGTIVGPIQELARATECVAAGQFDVHVQSTSVDELGVLTRSFNEMTHRLQKARQRRESWSRELEKRVKEKTREIEETKNHLTDIVENVGASIIVADLDGSIITSNSHTVQIFGMKPERIIGRNLHDFTCDSSLGSEALEKLLSGGGPLVYEARHQLDEKREMDLLITLTVLRDAEGKAAGFLQITKDISPLKTMERRVLESERLSAMGEMAGEIGHELNNYLSAIGGRAELIAMALERGNEDTVRGHSQVIAEQVGKMRILTEGLLQSARTESSPCEMDLNDAIRETVEFVRPQKRYQAITFDVTLSEKPVPVFADPQQIQQVILNLLANGADAVSATGREHGRLRLQTETTDAQAIMRISDDGIGIEAEVLPRVFEPRFTTKPNGHGFGLAVCHRVITTHRGEIRITSKPREGTRITVALPLLASRAPSKKRSPSSRGAPTSRV
jgi:PAS domain S-box-containing protein